MANPDDSLLTGFTAALSDVARTEDEQRAARIATEALQAFEALTGYRRAVTIFGSARPEPAERWGALAARTAGLLAREGFTVITGGGPGLMEIANAGAHAAGGDSVGLRIHLPRVEEPFNPHVLVSVPFHYFFLRKLAFVKYSCAFVCLPGGYGTLDEVFEALNLKRTQRIEPFPVILLGSSYGEGLRDWLGTTAVAAGTLRPDDLDLLEMLDDPEAVVERVKRCHAELCRSVGAEHGRG